MNIYDMEAKREPGVVAHTFPPSSQEVSLVYRANSKIASTTQRHPVLKNKTKQASKQTNKTKRGLLREIKGPVGAGNREKK